MPVLQSAVTFEQHENVLTAKIVGEIDHHSAKTLREKIDGEVCYRRPEKLIVDFSGVEFMDSSGLGLLLGRMKTAESLGCSFTLKDPSERIVRLLELAGADRLFHITRENISREKSKDKESSNGK